jgi:CspA family cold shock protein
VINFACPETTGSLFFRSFDMADRILGEVKWFNAQRGYGFIGLDDDEDKDIFVHYSAIEGEGFLKLEKGQKVEFSIEDGPKGTQAADVVAK